MITSLIVKLKLPPTPEQFRALRRTQLADRDALNFVSRFAFAHGKQSSTIAMLARQDWVSRGLLPERPDVSDAEAKAARRHRYAEWRWSPDR